MATLNKTIRRNIMRIFMHKVFNHNAFALHEEMLSYNKDLLEAVKEHYSKDIETSAKEANIKLVYKEIDEIVLRQRGSKKTSISIMNVNNKGPNISLFSFGNDPEFSSLNVTYYYTRSAINPDHEGAFEICNSWDTAIHTLLGCGDTRQHRPLIKIPTVNNPIKLPKGIEKDLIKRAADIEKKITEMSEALENINKLLSITRSTDVLKDVWPEGASIINHGIVASANTLPVAYIRKACKVANLK